MNVLVINYRKMLVGGIENYINSAVCANHEIGNRIIWIAETPLNIAPIYSSTFKKGMIEIVPINIHGFQWGSIPQLNITPDDNVTILSFGFLDHARALEYKLNNMNFKINAYYLIPHFTGPLVLPEQYFRNFTCIRRKIGRIYKKWIDNNSIIYFGRKHYETLISTYNIDIPDSQKKMVYGFNTRDAFSENDIRKRYKRIEFKIVGSGRFDFPHKGFFMGLIKSFAQYKEKYSNLSLYLIGEPIGKIDSMKMMKDLIDTFPEETKKSIHFLPNMQIQELKSFYKDCNLSVAVAGCATMSAQNGVLTLPARHYDYSCEVYGFCPESKNKTLDSSPGEPLSKYLDKALNMTEDEYVDICRRAYESYELPEINKNYYFEIEGNIINSNISENDLRFLKRLFFASKVIYKLGLSYNSSLNL